MDWFNAIHWDSVDWITLAIHVYAFCVLLLTFTVFFVHQSRLLEMARRLVSISEQVEGTGPRPGKLALHQMTSHILHLGDVVQRRGGPEIASVLKFVQKEQQQRSLSVVNTLVNLTETMIELFPILGILGTVWGISGVGEEEFSSERLLFLFGAATRTTLWALFYVVIFRIAYSAFVESKVALLQEYHLRFQEFLAVLEKRSSAIDVAAAGSFPGLDGDREA